MPDPIATPMATARRIIDANQYLTLATADDAGRPWATPVWYAHEDYTGFVWVSRPGTRHSRNIAVRATIAAVIFDSTVPAGEGRAVYLEATAAELTGAELDRCVAIFARRSQAHGMREWRTADVTAPARFRLYRATASAMFVLDDHDERIPFAITAN